MHRPSEPPTDTSPAAPGPTPSAGASPRAVALGLAALLFVSGAAGLVYEVSWTRRLLLLLGSTSTTSAVVLAAFLGGLGLGGGLGGRLADRSPRPIALYGVLELAAAAWALLMPLLLAGLSAPYVAVAGGAPGLVRLVLRIAVTALVVVPGAAAIGATYPALVAAAARRGVRVGGAAVLLYGVNTLGAVLGALWAGFFGIFSFGVLGASRVAAAGSAVVGVIALLAGARRPRAQSVSPSPAGAPPVPVPEPSAAAVPRAALIAAAACGFAALGLEAAGVRILVFFVQGFTPSFAAMLGVFLGGLALGTLCLGTPLASPASARAAVGALLVAAGVVALAETAVVLPHFEDQLVEWRRSLYADGEMLASQRWTAVLGSALLFLAPAFLLGASYPLCVRWAAGGGAPVGRAAGRVALWNGVGAVAAPLVVLALGRIGARDDRPGGPLLLWTAFAAVAALFGAGCLVAGLGRGRRTLLAGCAVGLAAGFVLPFVVMGATPLALVKASRVSRTPPGAPDGPRSVIAVRSDDTTTASVVEAASGDRTLYTDDFPAAATERGYSYMRLLGHLPALSVAHPQNAMVIAFGTGTTAGAVAAQADVERIEIAETSRAVLDLAENFRGVNRDVLSDPRVRVRVEDGRNALLLHAPDLDLVTLEPLLPFVPAALPFYTREFYELARSRLRPGGVLCQWVPVHAMPLDLYQALVKTFFETFPDGSIWYFEQSTALLGFVPGPRVDAETTRARAALMERALRTAGYGNPEAVVTAFVASGKRALAAIQKTPAGPLALETVTDEHPFPEAHPTPRAPLRTLWLADTLEWLAGLVTPDDDVSGAPLVALAPPVLVPALRQGTAAALRARLEEATADYLLQQGKVAQGADAMRRALAAYSAAMRDANLDDLALRRRHVRVERWTIMAAARDAFEKSDEAAARGDPSGAASAAEDALVAAKRAFAIESADPIGTGRPAAAAVLAEAYLRTGRCAEAMETAGGARGVWGWDTDLAALASAVSAHQHGHALDPATLPPDVGRALKAAPRCRDAGTAPVTAEIANWRGAWFSGKAPAIRLAGDLLMRRVASPLTGPTVARAEVAEALEAMGSPPNPAADVEREAVLRLLLPARPRFAALVLSDDPERAPVAIEAAGHYGVEAMALTEEATKGLAAKEAARRLLWVSALHDDGSPWAIERLLRTLDDADPAVRGEAAKKLLFRVPEARRAELAFDPVAPDAARSAARDRLRAFFAPK